MVIPMMFQSYLNGIKKSLIFDLKFEPLTRYYAKNRFGQTITFSNYPDWRGPRPVKTIPVSIRDRLVRTKAPFKVILMYGEGISTYLLGFSEDLNCDMMKNIKLYPYVDKDCTTISRIAGFRTNQTEVKGRFFTKSYLEIINVHIPGPIVIPMSLFELVPSKLKYPGYNEDLAQGKLTEIKSIEVIHNSRNQAGGINFIL